MSVHPDRSVIFYVPSSRIVNGVPDSISNYWSWIQEAVVAAPALLPDGQGPCTWLGPYNWTIQTYIYLRESGFPCRLASAMPPDGVIVAHGDFFPARLKPTARQFFVEIKPDRSLHCRFANYAVLQNPRDPLSRGVWRMLIDSAAVNYWTQPGLVPRDPRRGDRFENACFIGNREEMLADDHRLETELGRLGLTWRTVPRAEWHDYSEVDVVVAVRPEDERAATQKPASKLTNAWLAGVPAVLSPDVAFEALKQSPLDYLPARSVPEIVKRLTELRDDVNLRRAMSDNGRLRATEVAPERSVRLWTAILRDEVIPRYEEWTRSPLRRAGFYGVRALVDTAGRVVGPLQTRLGR